MFLLLRFPSFVQEPELVTIDWNLIGHTNMDANYVKSIPNNPELIDVGIAVLISERDIPIQHSKISEHSSKI